MSLKEHVYSILIVSASSSFASSLSGLIPETRYHPVDKTASINAAKRILAEKTYDFVIINAPLPDDAGTRFAIDTSTGRQTAVLLLLKEDVHSEIHDLVAAYGVFTLPKPTSRPTMLHALGWLESARERLRLFEKKSISIEDKMAEIRLVNKAKWILISQLHMSEPDAHRYVEKQAMDRCVSRKCIAEEIIRTYS